MLFAVASEAFPAPGRQGTFCFQNMPGGRPPKRLANMVFCSVQDLLIGRLVLALAKASPYSPLLGCGKPWTRPRGPGLLFRVRTLWYDRRRTINNYRCGYRLWGGRAPLIIATGAALAASSTHSGWKGTSGCPYRLRHHVLMAQHVHHIRAVNAPALL
jgi:hypothetical protein